MAQWLMPTVVDTTFVYVGGNFSESTNWLVGLSNADDGTATTDDSSQTTWGIYHGLGGGLKLLRSHQPRQRRTKVGMAAKELEYLMVLEPRKPTRMKKINPACRRDGARHLLGMRVDF